MTAVYYAKKALYSLGYYRQRVKNCVTVVMFHRVLPEQESERLGANPEWTVTPEFFDQCLAFFKNNYSVVDALDFIKGNELPKNALLITFDDGWRDNVQYALPVLKRHGLNALFFIATNAIGRHEPFWQERIYADLQHGKDYSRLGSCYVDIVKRFTQSPEQKDAWAASLNPWPHGRSFMNNDELRLLLNEGMALGGHGHSHEGLSNLSLNMAMDELSQSAATLKGFNFESATSMSFPHGKYTPELLESAHQQGFTKCFTSDQWLNQRTAVALGRLNINQQDLESAHDCLNPIQMAHYLCMSKVAA